MGVEIQTPSTEVVRLRRVILEAYWALTLISGSQPRTMDERRAKAVRILNPEAARCSSLDEERMDTGTGEA